MKYIIISIALSMCSVMGHAQNSVVISGIIEDDNAISDSARLDVNLNNYYSNRYFITLNKKMVERSVINADSFHFSFPTDERVSYLEIRYMSPNKNRAVLSRTRFYLGNNFYLLEKGDSVHMVVMKDSINFSGKGAEKMNMQVEFRRMEMNYPVINNEEWKNNHVGYFNSIVDRYEEICKRQIDFLNQHRDILEPSIYQMLYCNLLGKRNYGVLSSINSMIVAGLADKSINKTEYNLIAYQVLLNRLSVLDMQLSEEWHVSPHYMDYLLFKELFLYAKQDYDGTRESEKKIDQTDLYQIIDSKYSGKIKERLLTMGYSYLVNNNLEANTFLEKANNDVKTVPYLGFMKAFFNNSQVGQPAYEFELPDSTDNIVKLSDFKGKVVIVDFWFTGCIPCMHLKKSLEPIVEEYKDKDVVFITISIDKSKELWKEKGITSGLYTHPNGINLYTNGLGWESPIMKYYNIQGVPKMLLIDKNGRLVSVSPPRPNNEENVKGFKSLIDKALE